MAETITIPSPSVFLRASPAPPSQPKPQQPKHERKRSAATSSSKKKTKTTTATGNKTTDDGAITKPKQSKSRNGCVTCKAKRLKCDETKPGCLQCKRRSVECGGYKKDFKWRPFEETNVLKVNFVKHKKAPSQETQPPRVQNSSRLPSPNERTASEDNDKPTFDTSGSRGPLEMRPQQSAVSALQTPITSDDQDVGTALADANLPSPELTDSSQDCSVGENQARELPDHHVLDDNILLPTSMGSPTLSALEAIMCTMPPSTSEAGESVLAPGLLDAGDSELLSDPFVSFPPFHDLGGQLDMHDAEDIEEVIRPTMPISAVDCETWTLKFTSPHSSDSSSSPEEPSNSLVRGPFTYLYEQPSFPQDSPEMLTLRFDRLTCGILSVKDGPSENPWRSLIWPLTQQSPALYHAISSMTAFHSSRDVPSLRLTGHEHKDASIRNLGEGVHENSMNLDTAIATTLALAFAEVWDQHTSSGNVHIKGAKTMINIALEQHRRQAKSGLELARLKFLCNAWVYMDVIARLTSTDSDDSEDYDQLYCLYSTGSETDAGFGIDFGMPIDAQLDPLMGCASTLFPLIGRAANLVRRVRRASSNSPPVISQAMELKLLLETWDPPAFIEPPEDPTSSVQHTLQTAEAYRWATLLYLHQAVPEIPSLSSKEMAKKVLVYLATVPLASRCVIVHIYPLMAAGCEATTAEDRQWVRDRWNAMALRMRIGPLDKCMEVTEEVWRRKDEYDSRPINTRALVSTAELQISGIMSLKRACSSVDEGGAGWLDGFGPDRLQRRMTDTSGFRKRRGSREGGGQADLAHTVRGELHWLSVMQDWGWEVLLG